MLAIRNKLTNNKHVSKKSMILQSVYFTNGSGNNVDKGVGSN